MPFYFWLDLSFLFISLIISTALLLIVFGSSPKLPVNRAFSLFTLMGIIWAVSAILLRFSMWGELNQVMLPAIFNQKIMFKLTAVSAGSMSILSLLFTSIYLNKYNSKIKFAIGGGFILIALFVGISFFTEPFFNIKFNEYGLLTDRANAAGWASVLTIPSYMIASLILLYKNRINSDNNFLGLGLLIIYTGMILGGAFNLPFPSMSIFTALGLSLIGHSIIRLQILNPLKVLNVELHRLIAEKEALIRELHHRVKNNMQFVESMLGIQIRQTQNKETIEALQANKTRIHAIAKVHSRLYNSEDFSSIDFKNHLSQLIADYNVLYMPDNKITYKLDIEQLKLPIHTAVPCSLIINELITNAIKHAFSDVSGISPVIEIKIKETSGKIVIEVMDNGSGFKGAPDFKGTKTFGLFCVKLLAENQLGGDLKFTTANEGTAFTISFDLVNS